MDCVYIAWCLLSSQKWYLNVHLHLFFFLQVAEMYRSQETVKNNTKPAATADESDDFY